LYVCPTVINQNYISAEAEVFCTSCWMLDWMCRSTHFLYRQ